MVMDQIMEVVLTEYISKLCAPEETILEPVFGLGTTSCREIKPADNSESESEDEPKSQDVEEVETGTTAAAGHHNRHSIEVLRAFALEKLWHTTCFCSGWHVP